MQSIKQKAQPLAAVGGLPDFRNLGVLLRLLLLVNLLAAGTVLVRSEDMGALLPELMIMAGRLELPLFLSVLLLYLVQPWLARLRWRGGVIAVLSLALAVTALTLPVVGEANDARFDLGRSLMWAAAAAGIVVFYFHYRNRLFSRALTEARLMALTARIRPHFLFNCLNGVLGVMRADPRRAERALEELADLFRVLMRENRELVPLAQEIELCERYADLERLRLGDRLQLRWETEHCPYDALVPPLLLQPLLENAVYHGIEPAPETGEIVVRLYRSGNEVRLEVDNPVVETGRGHAGNRMALDNIRERLMLFFDLEAGLEIVRGNGRHRVRIRLPYRRTPK